ncbi:hypothetical protein [Chengkuizengella axinellae]|uniref:Uncharacterized protein n=1 Tax=Chengkuizengella axinellae TaxID=3064388 RepID=A0ABT9IWP7_9BACL|nr:hypothetical protein [Chengkuizengella sp. 2205SS18-9]MDP5273790.1 hypothetical protein [Chengkuizengella sp. 2205SS18-9]
MKRIWLSFISLFIILLSTGCMYPDDMRGDKSIGATRESITIVQTAVDAYQEVSGGLLPIKNSEMDTPIYEKYIIDFTKLGAYLGQIPPVAFENGGNYYFVLVNVEEDPTVKLMDIVSFQKINTLEREIMLYISDNNGKLPKGEQIYENWFSIDFDQLGQKRLQIKSPYSEIYLSPIVHTSGIVKVDYGIDILKKIESSDKNNIILDQDLRNVLVENSIFVPVKSNPYEWINEQPTIVNTF